MKMLFRLCSLVLLCVAVSGFGQKAMAQSEQEDGYVIGFSQATTTEPWRLLFNQELREEASAYPEITLLVRNAQDVVAKQIADVEEFIARKVDAILISPKVSDALSDVVSRAHGQNIPVFVLDRDLNTKDYLQFIGGDNVEIGRAAGRYVVERLGGKGKAKGRIAEIWGGMDSSPAQQRHKGFVEIIDQEPGLSLVSKTEDGDWKQDLGYEIMDRYLSSGLSFDVLYAHNDPMAYGAYLAALDHQKTEDILFVGIDGIPSEGVRWVSEGILDATFLYSTPGAEAVRQALAYLRGDTVPTRVTLPTATIDKTNADAILRRHGLLK